MDGREVQVFEDGGQMLGACTLWGLLDTDYDSVIPVLIDIIDTAAHAEMDEQDSSIFEVVSGGVTIKIFRVAEKYLSLAISDSHKNPVLIGSDGGEAAAREVYRKLKSLIKE